MYNSDQISSLKVHELNLYLVRHGIVFKGKKPEKVSYMKYISLAGSYQAWRKGLREETSTLGSESDEEERIVGSETLSTSSRELSDISDSPALHTVDTTSRYGRKRTRVVLRSRQLRAMAKQEEKRKKE